jgi:hypothetical protein
MKLVSGFEVAGITKGIRITASIVVYPEESN